MTTIQNVNRTSTVAPGTAAPNSVSDPDGASASLVPEPLGGLGDDAYTALAMLLTKADESDRKASQALEQTADEAATAEENQRVQQMQDKAHQDEMQGWANGIGDIAAGAFTIGGAFATCAPSATNGSSEASDAASEATAATDASKQVATHFDWHAALPAIGTGAQGAGTITAGVFKGKADGDDAQAAQYDAESQAEVRRYNEMHDRVTAANDSVQKVEQFLDQIQQTQNATRLAAATRA